MLYYLRSAFIFFILLSVSRSEVPNCDDLYQSSTFEAEIKKLMTDENANILGVQFNLTSLKLALKLKRSSKRTIERYLKVRERDLREHVVVQRLTDIYKEYGITEDQNEISKILNYDEKKYSKGSRRLTNKSVSAYILADIQKGNSKFKLADAAIIRAAHVLSEASLNSHEKFSADYNLTQISNRLAILSGYVDPKNALSEEEIINSIEEQESFLKYHFEKISNFFKEKYKDCFSSQDEKCLAIMIDDKINLSFLKVMKDIIKKGQGKYLGITKGTLSDKDNGSYTINLNSNWSVSLNNDLSEEVQEADLNTVSPVQERPEQESPPTSETDQGSLENPPPVLENVESPALPVLENPPLSFDPKEHACNGVPYSYREGEVSGNFSVGNCFRKLAESAITGFLGEHFSKNTSQTKSSIGLTHNEQVRSRIEDLRKIRNGDYNEGAKALVEEIADEDGYIDKTFDYYFNGLQASFPKGNGNEKLFLLSDLKEEFKRKFRKFKQAAKEMFPGFLIKDCWSGEGAMSQLCSFLGTTIGSAIGSLKNSSGGTPQVMIMKALGKGILSGVVGTVKPEIPFLAGRAYVYYSTKELHPIEYRSRQRELLYKEIEPFLKEATDAIKTYDQISPVSNSFIQSGMLEKLLKVFQGKGFKLKDLKISLEEIVKPQDREKFRKAFSSIEKLCRSKVLTCL